MREDDKRDAFNWYLQLPVEDLTWETGSAGHFEADDISYLINPRRLRGSDFLMRWSQGRWSEEIATRALNNSGQFGVLPYGPSTVAPDEPAALERFFEEMEVIAKEGKRPDLLLYHKHVLD